MTEIYCENLFFKYPNTSKIILKHLNISFSSGQIIGLVGLNGSGKTTLLKLITGILHPTDGKIFYNENLTKDSKLAKNSAIFLPENAKLFLIGPTVKEEFLRFMTTKEEVELFLKSFYLDSLLYKKLYELSEGQRRLIAILSALKQNKEIFILDEPTIGIDSIGRSILFEVIKSIKFSNGIVIIATNDTRILNEMDRLVCLKDGDILIDAEPREALFKLESMIGIIPNQVSRLVTDLRKKKLTIPNIITTNEMNSYLQSLED